MITLSSTSDYTLLRTTEITLRLLDDERDQSADESYTIAGKVMGLISTERVVHS